jgi:hypothetical protein
MWWSSLSKSYGRDIYVPPDLSAMTSDARKWYETGVSNANKNLVQFKTIADLISSGGEYKPLLRKELSALLSQAKEANDNTQKLVPVLTGFIDSLAEWTKDPISWWAKMKLKAALWYVQGKRDNKSYYLQNGAGLWAKLRVDNYLKPLYGQSAEAKMVGNDLEQLKEDVLYARDELDDAAQIYVKGMNQLQQLKSDICKNAEEMRKVVAEMQKIGGERSENIKKSAQDSVEHVRNVMEKY